jgi:hypothetical protein
MWRSNGGAPHVGPVQLPEIRDRVVKGAGEAVHRAAEAVEVTGSRVSKLDAAGYLSDARTAALSRAGALAAKARRKADSAAVRLQLANTSRELAHETSDLGQAVESLNAIVKANRKAGSAKRRRLFAGMVLGAGLAYHLDPAQGQRRRAATMGVLMGAARGGLSKARAAAEARGIGRPRSA